MNYHNSKTLNTTFAEALAKVKSALEAQGFGIISEIDLTSKFKEKLGIDFRNYRILGACNPKLAYQAIQQEERIGVLLPCNILVQEHGAGQVEVTAVNPMETMAAVNNQNLEVIAQEVSAKLQSVISSL
jgi:uncharacterized protein (DUF302 family)